jgi:hypothetical protein
MDLSVSRLTGAAFRAALCCSFLTLIPLHTMATENTPPTVADYLKRQELTEAETKALEAEKKLIETKLALEEAKKKLNAIPIPPDANEQAVAAAKAAKELAEAEKAVAEARIAAFKAKYGGVPDGGIAGDVTLSDKAGTLEMTLLAHRALADAAKMVAAEVHAKLIDHAKAVTDQSSANETTPTLTLYLYPAAQLPNFQTVANFAVQRDAVKEALNQAYKAADSTLEAIEQRTEGALTPAMLGVALESITKLLGFFRSDYKVGGSEITLDDIALVQAVAGQDLACRAIVPMLYYPQAVRGAATLVNTELQELTAQQAQAKELSDKLELVIAKKQEKAADPAITAEKKASTVGQIGILRPLADRLKAATVAYDTMLNRLMAPDEATGTMLRDLAVWNGLNQSGGRLLLLKVQRAGGSNYTEKNLLNFFGKMPFYVAGGAVVSYTLLMGEDGTVLASGLLPVHGGFEMVKQVPAMLPAQR